MGNKILIYENGQRYEMDSDLIYLPWFIAGRRSGKTNMAMEALRQAKENGLTTLVLGDKDETNKVLPMDT
jgi:hypothetical protein